MIPVWPLLLLLSASSPTADATTTTAGTLIKSSRDAVCSGHRVSIPSSSSRAWLPLNHRHGPCSPFPSSSPGRIPSTADALLRAGRLRADTIRRRLNGSCSSAAAASADDVTIPTTLGAPLLTYEYVVTVGLGTPAVAQTMHIDTGGEISWVQCRPCPAPTCHPQKDAVFDPAKSATYSPYPCASAACRALGTVYNGCSGSLCQYVAIYGDGSNSSGTYSSDKLTLTPGYAVDGFRFGCSHADPQFSALTAGLLGLSRGALSLVGQTAEKAFSHCLPPTERHSGFLTFGVPHVAASRFVVTPMRKIGNIGAYYAVRLQGIMVAGRRLHVPPSVFAAGSVVDSGTVITQLPATAYRALQAAFSKEMRMYPQAAPTNGFDTCFNLTGAGGDVKLPSVALVFERGATVELDPSGILFDDCLAFFSTGDDTSFGIIGNVQQRTLEVLYDIGGQAVGFRRGAC